MRFKPVVRLIVVLLLFGFSPTFADNIFYVDQCRVLDTRPFGGALPAGIPFTFQVRGPVGGMQGGTVGCGVPIEASGVMVVVTSTAAAGAGHLEVYPAPVPPTLPTSRLNYTTGLNIADEVLVRLLPYDDAQDDLAVKAVVSSTHVLVDVVGYTVPTPRQKPFNTFANAPFAPGALTPGDAFIVRDGIGAFAGHDNEWATWTGTTWDFSPAYNGDLAYEKSSGLYFLFRSHIPVWSMLQLQECQIQHSYDIRYDGINSQIWVPATSSTNLAMYGPVGRVVHLGGQASQPGDYTITGIGETATRKFLTVSPTPQTATDQALDVHLVSIDCF